MKNTIKYECQMLPLVIFIFFNTVHIKSLTKLAGKFTLTLSEVERGVFVFFLLQGVYQYGLPLMSVYMPCGNGFSQLAD